MDNYVDRERAAGTEDACVAPVVGMAVDSTSAMRSDTIVGVTQLRGRGGCAPEEGRSSPGGVKWDL